MLITTKLLVIGILFGIYIYKTSSPLSFLGL